MSEQENAAQDTGAWTRDSWKTVTPEEMADLIIGDLAAERRKRQEGSQ